MTPEELADLGRRINRASTRARAQRIELLALKAECERHSGNVITADEIYKQVADELLSTGRTRDRRSQRILLEAATVAKLAIRTELQLRRAIRYLEAIQDSDFSTTRVLGMLAELNALVGDQAAFDGYESRVRNLLRQDPARFSMSQVHALEDALHRGTEALQQRRRPPQGTKGEE